MLIPILIGEDETINLSFAIVPTESPFGIMEHSTMVCEFRGRTFQRSQEELEDWIDMDSGDTVRLIFPESLTKLDLGDLC